MLRQLVPQSSSRSLRLLRARRGQTSKQARNAGAAQTDGRKATTLSSEDLLLMVLRVSLFSVIKTSGCFDTSGGPEVQLFVLLNSTVLGTYLPYPPVGVL